MENGDRVICLPRRAVLDVIKWFGKKCRYLPGRQKITTYSRSWSDYLIAGLGNQVGFITSPTWSPAQTLGRFVEDRYPDALIESGGLFSGERRSFVWSTVNKLRYKRSARYMPYETSIQPRKLYAAKNFHGVYQQEVST